jgi:hypothetical protein
MIRHEVECAVLDRARANDGAIVVRPRVGRVACSLEGASRYSRLPASHGTHTMLGREPPIRDREAAMTLGPLEYTVIGFRDNEHFTGRIAEELEKVTKRGVIRIVDIVFVAKAEDGEIAIIEADGLDQKAFEALKPALQDHMGLLTAEDVATLALDIPAGTSAMMIMFEHRWAEHLKEAIGEAGGFLVARETIPPEIVAAISAEIEAGAVVGA